VPRLRGLFALAASPPASGLRQRGYLQAFLILAALHKSVKLCAAAAVAPLNASCGEASWFAPPGAPLGRGEWTPARFRA